MQLYFSDEVDLSSRQLEIREINSLPVVILTRIYKFIHLMNNTIISVLNILLVVFNSFPVKLIGKVIYTLSLPVRIIFRIITLPIRLILKFVRMIKSIIKFVLSPIKYVLNLVFMFIKPRSANLFPSLPYVNFYFTS